MVCWTETRLDEVRGRSVTLTVCKVVGTEHRVEYASEVAIPVEIFPNVGRDQSDTECWYWITWDEQWVIISRTSANMAHIAYDPDGIPGGPLAQDTLLPACESEPRDEGSEEDEAWRLIEEYVHRRPDPRFDPVVGRGLAGLETFVVLGPPAPFDDTLVSPATGAVLQVQGWVAAVVIDWGDGTVETFTPLSYPLLTGSPDGIARHVYEVKTCHPPGAGPRCHPHLSAYPLTVSYEWSARWRAGGGPWQNLAVPATITAVDYPVTEVVAVLTG